MSIHEEESFQPELLDEQIEQCLATGTQQKTSMTYQMLQDLQISLEIEAEKDPRAADKHSLEQAWQRISLAGSIDTHSSIQTSQKDVAPLPIIVPQQYRRQTARSQRWPHLSVLVAVLVAALLVGSMLITLKVFQTSQHTAQPTTPTKPIGSVITHIDKPVPILFLWSRDSKNLLSSNIDPNQHPGINIWNAYTGKPKSISLHLNDPKDGRALLMSPDQRSIVDIVPDNINIWNIEKRSIATKLALSHSLKMSDVDYSATWSPDSTKLAVDSNGKLTIWDAKSGQVLHIFSVPANLQNLRLKWLQDNVHLIGINKQAIMKWDTSTGQLLQSLSLTSELANKEEIYSIDSSPNGKYIAGIFHTTIKDQVILHIWDTNTLQAIPAMNKTLENPAMINTTSTRLLTWSPDSTRLALNIQHAALNQPDEIQVINAATGQTMTHFQDKYSMIRELDWSPDSKHIVSSSLDKKNAVVANPYKNTTKDIVSVVQINNAANGEREYTFAPQNGMTIQITWSPDGKLIAGLQTGKNSIYVWSAA
ncbi:hypothetical protein KDW_10290 [Dictyobacter vulcani]|uniref:Anaphase-promoting complex subunit 4 WD40 domain-containing protein n=1 Tax=Dictyobacter vulcani TaxID=2607529 RepID=A0A5J4KKA8_9CHLR|nr:PD40 domain-containing protein [Dictyobacter vulcani]GER86867.1 hypothetical protein KDW_10290 [Dictyobacter vulcani]